MGGVVRTTGSGMGCPDWPKCFGQWVPPTTISELPADYKETYSALRDKKNKKFASYLNFIGLDQTADQILKDRTILVEADFNATKTWIEYLNRLVGVVIGFLIIAVFLASIKFRKLKPSIFWVALSTLLLVIVQGWFGSIVVSTNLTTWTITIHMFLAIVIVGQLAYLETVSRQNPERFVQNDRVRWLLFASMAATLIQIFMGTQVREMVDILAQQIASRQQWINNLGISFVLHRSFSWIVLIINGLLIFSLLKTTLNKVLIRGIIVLILLSLFSGIGMAYGGFPAALQPLHLLVATMTIGFQLMIYFRMNTKDLALLNQKHG